MESKSIFDNLPYQNGFGNYFSSEAKEGAVAKGTLYMILEQNNPLKNKYGLYTEQLSGTAFTVKRSDNQKSWLYKVRPSVVEGQYKKSVYPYKIVSNYLLKDNIENHPNAMRWNPIPSVKEGESVHFVQGLTALLGAGEPSLKQGTAIYAYSANKSMEKTAFYNSDGDFLIVPHIGTLYVKTLNGLLTVKPK